MPFTGSHPAAILPFKRWCKQTPYFVALVIGSMSPDFGYFSPVEINTRYSHTLEGIVVMDLPTSISVLFLVLVIRKSFCYLLPNPHRNFLLSFCAKPSFSWKMVLITLLCLSFGALTHVVWDSLTHGISPLVRKSEWLKKEPWFEIPIYRLIQHTSTLLGGLILLIAYYQTLRKKGYRIWPKEESQERKRYGIWFSIGMVSLMISFAKTKLGFGPLQNSYDYQIFAFRFVVSSLSIAFVLIVLMWLSWWLFPKFRSWLNHSETELS